MVDIFARLEKNAGGPIGQYMSYAHGYFAFPKLEGEIGPDGLPVAPLTVPADPLPPPPVAPVFAGSTRLDGAVGFRDDGGVDWDFGRKRGLGL